MQEPELDVPENKALHYVGVAFVSVLLAVLVLKGLDLMATRGGSRAVRPPKLPDQFVLRPEFETAAGKNRGGAGFAVRVEGDARRLVLTALHLVENTAGGPPAGVKKVYFRDAFGSEGGVPIGTATAFLEIPSAATHGKPSEAGDVIGIWAAEDCFFPTVPLATQNPAPGESIWLVCPILKGAPEKLRLHHAKVDSVTDGDLVYWFDNSNLDVTDTNGAPLVNSAGEVVGIHLNGALENGKMSGFGNPVERFREPLKQAAKATPDKAAIKDEPIKRPKAPSAPK